MTPQRATFNPRYQQVAKKTSYFSGGRHYRRVMAAPGQIAVFEQGSGRLPVVMSRRRFDETYSVA